MVASCAALTFSTALVLGAFMAFHCYGHDSPECMEFAGSLYTDTYFRDFKEARLSIPELIYFDWQDLANWRVAFGTIPNFMGVPPVELIDSSRFFSMLNLIAACVKPIFSIGAALIEIVGWVNKSKAVSELAEATASVCAVLDAYAEDEDHRHMINGLRGMGLDVSDCKVNEEKKLTHFVVQEKDKSKVGGNVLQSLLPYMDSLEVISMTGCEIVTGEYLD